MIEMPFMERIRTIMQNQHVGLDYERGTPSEQEDHLRKMRNHQRAFEAQMKDH